jgi:hypothetical protein
MTESEWQTCNDPTKMLGLLRGRVSDRKLRLFAVACCNLIFDLIPTEESRECVRLSEEYADGNATDHQLELSIGASMASCKADSERRRLAGTPWSWIEVQAINAVGRVHRTVEGGRFGVLHAAALARAWDRCMKKVAGGDREYALEEADGLVVRTEAIHRETDAETSRQAVLLRDVVGFLAFRPVTFDPSWRSANVVSLAQAIYDDRAFDRLPVLADALEESGCTSSEMLEHCRGSGEHVRGCWLVDLLLLKG